jgi:hypothetical protein
VRVTQSHPHQSIYPPPRHVHGVRHARRVVHAGATNCRLKSQRKTTTTTAKRSTATTKSPTATTSNRPQLPKPQPPRRHHPAGRGPGGPRGPGRGLGTITAVNLNTNGVSPGGANTAEVVKAARELLSLLDSATLDAVTFEFSENKARQTWSNSNNSGRTETSRAGEVVCSAARRRVRLAQCWLAANSSDGNSGFGNLLYYVAKHHFPVCNNSHVKTAWNVRR